MVKLAIFRFYIQNLLDHWPYIDRITLFWRNWTVIELVFQPIHLISPRIWYFCCCSAPKIVSRCCLTSKLKHPLCQPAKNMARPREGCTLGSVFVHRDAARVRFDIAATPPHPSCSSRVHYFRPPPLQLWNARRHNSVRGAMTLPPFLPPTQVQKCRGRRRLTVLWGGARQGPIEPPFVRAVSKQRFGSRERVLLRAAHFLTIVIVVCVRCYVQVRDESRW